NCAEPVMSRCARASAMRSVACFRSKFALLARAMSEVRGGSLKLAHHASVIGPVEARLCLSALAPGRSASCVQPVGVSGCGGVKSGPSAQPESKSASKRRGRPVRMAYSMGLFDSMAEHPSSAAQGDQRGDRERQKIGAEPVEADAFEIDA